MAKIALQRAFRAFDGSKFSAAGQKPLPIQVKFSVTRVFCVPIIGPNTEFCRCHCA
jgi:hypothetical protein